MHAVVPIAAVAVIVAAVPAVAQTPAAPSATFTAPRAYAGYSQPAITNCTSTGALKRQCVVPAMTAGRYLIVAAGTATATGAKATQSLSISLDGRPCISVKPQVFTGKKSLAGLVCEATFLTDAPITVTATFSVENGAPDPAGPRLAVDRVPWNGVVDARGLVVEPKPPEAASGK